MAKQAECVWFRNRLTGAVDGVDKGSAAHRRMATEAIDDEDGVPFMVWEELRGGDIPAVKSVKYTPGMQAEVFEAGEPGQRRENPPESAEAPDKAKAAAAAAKAKVDAEAKAAAEAAAKAAAGGQQS